MTVEAGCLLLVHAPTTVATATAACHDESNQGHEDNVEDPDGSTHQEAHLVDQELDTHMKKTSHHNESVV